MPPNTSAATQGTLQESPPPSPLATSRITHYDGQSVTYWYADTATGQRVTVKKPAGLLRKEKAPPFPVTCTALDFISRMIPHIPPRGMQVVRYAGLYARNVKRKLIPAVHAALEALRLQPPLLDLEPLAQTLQHLTWRERIKASCRAAEGSHFAESPRWKYHSAKCSRYNFIRLECQKHTLAVSACRNCTSG